MEKLVFNFDPENAPYRTDASSKYHELSPGMTLSQPCSCTAQLLSCATRVQPIEGLIIVAHSALLIQTVVL